MARGRLSDGKTARVVGVEIALEDRGLRLIPEGQGDLFAQSELWLYEQIRLIDDTGAELRLGLRDDPDVRLVAPSWLRSDLAEQAPYVRSRERQSLRTGLLVVLGIVGMISLIGSVFVGFPLGAGPLARATPAGLEKRLGDLAAAQLSAAFPACEGAAAARGEVLVDQIVAPLQRAAGIERPIAVRFVDNEAPNALTLPGDQIWVTSGLLEALEEPDELAAVLAHELAHVKARDGLEGFYRRFGMGLVLDAATGGSGVGQQVVLIGGQIADLGFTRSQEDRADVEGVRILASAGHNPEALSRAFDAIEERSAELLAEREARDRPIKLPLWLSTHPDTAARKARARTAARPTTIAPIPPEAWAAIRNACALDQNDLPADGAPPSPS